MDRPDPPTDPRLEEPAARQPDAPLDESAAPETAPEPEAEATPPKKPRSGLGAWLAERPDEVTEVSQQALRRQSRRDFLLFGAATAAALTGMWWLMPDRARSRFAIPWLRDALNGGTAKVGLTRERREQFLDRSLRFDDDVAEALYSKDRSVRTYHRSEVTPLKNNYHGRTPTPDALAGWSLNLSGLANGAPVSLSLDQLQRDFPHREQVTRLVCVEGWSAIAWWGGFRFADLLAAYPPAEGARWAAMRSTISLDGNGNPETYYVSIDLETARHLQTLLVTHKDGRPLPMAHGAPLRLIAPMKLGLKNIKGLTDIEYTAAEPPDFWHERGYSSYDGL
jgi:DMSO/TMAO reductase YedYZ molybdopterin-dependent catalytic subunit